MKVIPILFQAPMVNALLKGNKTQTRRMIEPQPHPQHALSPAWGRTPCGHEFGERGAWIENGPDYPDCNDDVRRHRFGEPGDLLWVRERTGQTVDARGYCALIHSTDDIAHYVLYEDAGEGDAAGLGKRLDRSRCLPVGRWKPSIHMDRWACRLVLRRVGDVRVERLLSISDADARAEGVDSRGFLHGRFTPTQAAYFALWDEINGPQQAGLNPWVWVIPFEVAAKTVASAQRLLRATGGAS